MIFSKINWITTTLVLGIVMCAVYLTLVFAEIIKLPFYYGFGFLLLPLAAGLATIAVLAILFLAIVFGVLIIVLALIVVVVSILIALSPLGIAFWLIEKHKTVK